MNVQILDQAVEDLIEGFHYYQEQQAGLGSYFLQSLYSDIDTLAATRGIHRRAYRHYHRLLSKRFPFAVFYTVENKTVFVRAVVDCRRDPAWIRKRLG